MPQINNPRVARPPRYDKMPKEASEETPTQKRKFDADLAKRCYYMRLDGFGLTETGNILGISPGRVYSLIAAAKKRGLV